MRTKLLMMSTAALLAGTLLAAGQSIQPGGSAQEKGAQEKGVQEKGASQGQLNQGQLNKGQPAKEQADKAQPDKAQPGKAEPGRNVQSNEGTRGQVGGPAQGSAQGKAPPTTSGQAPSRDEDRKGQAQRDQEKQQPQGREGAQPRERTEGQAPRDQDRTQQQGQTQRDQGRTQQQGEREGQRGGNVSVSLTTEQRTKIRETVIKERNAPRVAKVEFSVREGTVVPRTVRMVEVPDVIVEIHPDWRGFKYFIVNDELVVVEPDTLRIVAVIPV
ncbi:MAG TPA: DUF1236 domain-containing protein [Xanthobacteraceae bacterium]